MVYIREQIDGHIIETSYEDIWIPKENVSMIAKTLDNKTTIFVNNIAVIIDQDFESTVEDCRRRKVDNTIE